MYKETISSSLGATFISFKNNLKQLTLHYQKNVLKENIKSCSILLCIKIDVGYSTKNSYVNVNWNWNLIILDETSRECFSLLFIKHVKYLMSHDCWNIKLKRF